MEKLSKIAALQIAEEAERNGHPFSKEEDLQYYDRSKLRDNKPSSILISVSGNDS